jgi:NAD dependent epimerase/dehydratase family enzyme
LPIPASVIKILLGEMGQSVLLEGARAIPAKLQAEGLPFSYLTLESALSMELGKMNVPDGWGDVAR